MDIDLINLQRMVDQKYISVQEHPSLPLYIYNYTQKAQFNRVWNNETLVCRGLIMNDKHEIVSRPFRKFFNLAEALANDEQIPAEDFIVTEKMDGSLGITYFDDGGSPHLATRGSFTSDQALKGTSILHNKYLFAPWSPNLTYLVEIIYPENRIVVDYAGIEDLVLLAIIDTKSGKELAYNEVQAFAAMANMPIVKKYDGIKDFSAIEEQPNAEGYVITFLSGQRYKVKFDEYVRLHRLVTGVNARTIWDLLRNDQPFDELIERVPDEFYDWVIRTKTELLKKYAEYEISAKTMYEKVKNMESRKEQALYLLNAIPREAGIVFNMLDHKPYKEQIWKMLRPQAEKPFKEDIDA